jgi:hypothetical protein
VEITTRQGKVHTVQMLSKDDFGEFFSDLAIKNFELLASLASALKFVIPPLVFHIVAVECESAFNDKNIIINDSLSLKVAK